MCLLKMRIVARPLNNNKPSPIVRTSQVTKLMVLGFKKPISCKEKKSDPITKHIFFLLDKFFFMMSEFFGNPKGKVTTFFSRLKLTYILLRKSS